MKYDITIVTPGIRTENWIKLYDDVVKSCDRHSFEMIFVGPHKLPQELQYVENIKYIKDLGTTSRCFQMGLVLAEGRFTTWACDDTLVCPGAISNAIDLLLSVNPDKDMIGLRYSEGPGHSAPPHPDDYYKAWYHPDLHADKVDKQWDIPCIILMNTQYYYQLGGLDCAFESLNMNVHDLGFRAQMNGSKSYLSKDLVFRADFEIGRTEGNSPVIAAFHQHDRPLFHDIYSADKNREISIDINNWKLSPSVWHRRKKIRGY